MATGTETRDNTPLLPIATVLIVSFAVSSNTLANVFVYDDVMQVLENRWIRDVGYLPDIFRKGVWSFLGETTSNFYRPMMHVIYMASYHLFGLSPWGFHLVNLLFHAGVSVLVFLAVARLCAVSFPGPSPPSVAGGWAGGLLSLPFIAALLFATHPVHTEAVAWVAGLPDLSFSFFFLLSFVLYIDSTRGTGFRKGRYALSVASFFLSALSKEPALTLPLILVAYDHLFGHPEGGVRRRWKRYVPYLLVAAVYFGMRLYALGGIAPEGRHEHLSALQHVINIFPLFSGYLGKLLLPVNLNAFHVFHPIASLFGTKGILSVAVAAAFAGMTAVACRKNRMACFFLLFLVVPLLPAFYIRGLGLHTFAERYLYLPSVGFVALAAMLMTSAAGRIPNGKITLIGALALVTVLYSVGTVKRNAVWKENLTLFSDTVKKSPDHELPQRELGNALLETGRVEEAIARYDKAIALGPFEYRVYNNRGLAFHEMGLLDLAMADFDRALALNPRSCEAHNNKGKIYGQSGSFDKAIEQFGKAIDIKPDFPLAYGNRGLAHFLVGDYGKAWKDVNRAIELDDRYAEAYGARGEIYLRTGNKELAVSDFRKACTLGNHGGCRALQALLPPTGNPGRR
jgi:tetratricopeptide (TPR) repeat protein